VASGTTTVTVAARDGSGNESTAVYEIDEAGSGSTLTYDANGSLIGDGTRTFTWDAQNRLQSVAIGTTTTEFTYDGFDRRVRIVEKYGSTTTSDKRFVWCDLELCEERDASGASVAKRFLNQGVQESGVSFFYSQDHLRSTREMTDSAGVVRARYSYDPFGSATKVSGDKDSEFTFTGAYAHPASGLLLTPYRAYDSALGRWLSEDPAGFAAGSNLYAYVGGAVTRFSDPSGLGPVGAIIGGVIGGVLGAVTGAAGLAGGPTVFVTEPLAVAIGASTGAALGHGIEETFISFAKSLKNPWRGSPGSEVTVLKPDGTPKQTRRYGPDGYPETDTDWDHSHDQGQPHVHDWGRPPDGGSPTEADRAKPGRAPRPGDPGFVKNSCP
jgi:RHS repeat-associated protein